MRLFDILKGVCATTQGLKPMAGLTDCDVCGVTDDSGEYSAGYIYIAVTGKSFDGHAFALKHCENSAAVVVSSGRASEFASFKNVIAVPDTRAVIAPLVSAFYESPTRSLKLVAVTGTNGKSTFAAMLKHIIVSQGYKCGVIGTIGFDVCNNKVYEAHYSLPPARLLYRYFREMVDNGAEYCVVEATSQALAQDRIRGERFAVGVFTNLTRDHLDYHGDMESYFNAKAKLFTMCDNAVICVDEDYGKRLAEMIKNGMGEVSEGQNSPYREFCPSDFLKYGRRPRVPCKVTTFSSDRAALKLNMFGGFNLQNAGLAVEAAAVLGFDKAVSAEALANFGGVSGRCEVVYSGVINSHNVTVICDYAHTEDALEKILSASRQKSDDTKSLYGDFVSSELCIITLFGATGERDKGKRKPIGALLSRMSDYTVLTSDNPNFEDPDDIISQVLEGFADSPSQGAYAVYPDRGEAVVHACKMAAELAVNNNVVLLLCGKGHERYQTIRGDFVPFDECAIATREMSKYCLG